MIAVAIFLTLSAIAAPQVRRSRIAANQASAVAACRVINAAEVTYRSTFDRGFSSHLDDLGPGASPPTPTAAGMIDEVLATGSKNGYRFSYLPSFADPTGRIQAYVLYADPIEPQVTGIQHFYTDHTRSVRTRDGGPARRTDPAVAGNGSAEDL